MDFNNISSITQSQVCRCCLSNYSSLNANKVINCVIDTVPEDNFMNILRDCLNISLSCMEFADTSKYICKICAKRLVEVSNFHIQVTKANKLYENYWNQNTVNKHNLHKIKDGNSNHVGYDYDLDPTIAMLNASIAEECSNKLNENYLDKINVESKFNINPNPNNNTDLNHMKTASKSVKVQAQMSERKRVILTCDIVLKETTACPFRHHKSWFQCFFCSQDFMELGKLRDHTLKSHADIEAELKKIKRYPRTLQIDISTLKCRGCSINLFDVDSMKSHLFEKHDKIVYKECIADYKVDSSPYTCHLCKMEFHVFRTLTTHLNEHYANCICDVCGKSFLNSKRLKVHKRTHENGIYPCAECGKILTTKISRANHVESVHSKRVIKCQICLKPMKHYNDRIKHMSQEHNITHTFKCHICDRVYNIKHYLATHIRQTHGSKNKKCTVCGMAFITNHGLKKHMLRHTGDRPFTCAICCKAYARSYTLREHMKVHENDNRLVTPP